LHIYVISTAMDLTCPTRRQVGKQTHRIECVRLCEGNLPELFLSS